MSDPSVPCPSSSTVLLTRLAKQVYRRSNEELLGCAMRLVMALSYVRDNDGTPQQALGDAFLMDANNVVLLLNELEDMGYVERKRDPGDRRRHIVVLTDDGRTALAHAEEAQKTIEDEVFAALDPDERETLQQLLGRALSAVESVESCAYNTTVASIST